MAEPQNMPMVDEMALQAIAQNSASVQAVVEQIVALAGGTAKAMQTAKHAVDMVKAIQAEMSAVRSDVEEVKTQVSDVERQLRDRITIDGQQEGILYQAAHDRAAWAFKNFPEQEYGTHIRRIWTKVKRDCVVSKYRYIKAKDYNYAMQAVLAYPGFGRDWQVK